MPGKPINLFMWGYQPHFRHQFERQANRVIEELGVPGADVECLLVGAKGPRKNNFTFGDGRRCGRV